MSITTIILSKDRPAQLDLLLRSIEANGRGYFAPWCVYKGAPIPLAVPCDLYAENDPLRFEQIVRVLLGSAAEYVCFMCDDGILYRPVPSDPTRLLDHDVLCVSLRLGENTTTQYPTGLTNERQAEHLTRYGNAETLRDLWDWQDAKGDYGYPGSIDAHIFRTADVQRMLAGRTFPNPTSLECALVEGCVELADERPLMAAFPRSVYVGNPINRVSEQSGVRFGQTFPVTAEECNRRFLAGERVDLDSLDFSRVDGAHTEIELRWTTPPA